MPFYNTINLSGDELKKAVAETDKQVVLIEKIFKANPGVKLSPSDILHIVQDNYQLKWLLTSIRRAMTDLSSPKEGDVLQKMAETKIGPHGSKEHYWILKVSAPTPEKPLPGTSVGEFAGKILEQTSFNFNND